MRQLTAITATVGMMLGLASTAALAQDKLKIGIIATLSGPPAVLGGQVRDGFNLAVKTLGGKLGGRDVEVIVVDDELKPDVAVTKVKGLVERDKVDFVVGPIFSNILQAINKPVTDGERVPDQPQRRHVELRRQAVQSEFLRHLLSERPGVRGARQVRAGQGLQASFLMAPNYQAGKDALAGFKRYFKGEVVDEVYVPLDQLDFLGRALQDRAPEAGRPLHVHAGRHGRQLRQAVSPGGARRQDHVPVGVHGRRSRRCRRSRTPPSACSAARTGRRTSTIAQNKEFVAAFEKEYGAVPGTYAMQAYDAALLIDSALKATGGKTDDRDALRAALKKADFKSLRGNFKFDTNHYPIQDFYLVKVAKRADGKYQTEIVEKVFANYADPSTPRIAR